ncbi:MAG: DUF72 domain-containing protein [bacterium]
MSLYAACVAAPLPINCNLGISLEVDGLGGSDGRVRIGTSGWHYEEWAGPFYPQELSPAEWLAYYARRFSAAEVNNTFYQLPEEETLRTWRSEVPGDFLFAVKASRYLTHMKKLKDPKDPLGEFLGAVVPLEENLGPILYQLPPNWSFDGERLASFLQVLPSRGRHVLEFRDPSWQCEEAYELLGEHGAALCIHDKSGEPAPKVLTAGFTYLRFHGPEGEYARAYEEQDLAGWAGAISSWREEGVEVFAFFNNDHQGHAPRDAARLAEMLGSG